MNNFQKKYGPWALVTGASSGIGKELAHELASRNLNLVIVARRQELLDTLKEALARKYGVEVRSVAVDLTTPMAFSIIEEATADIEIGLLVPNAGMAMAGEFIESDLEDNIAMIQLNVLAPLQLAHEFGRKMALREHGGILFTSGVLAYQAIPMMANYAATKAYVLLLAEALHNEFKPRGVDVTVLSPGLTATDMPVHLPIDFSKLPMWALSPKRVARTGVNALGQKSTVVAGFISKFYAWQNRLVPRVLPVMLFGFLMRRASKGRSLSATAAEPNKTGTETAP